MRKPALTMTVLKGLGQMALFCKDNPLGSHMVLPPGADSQAKHEQVRACEWIEGMLGHKGVDIKQEIEHGPERRRRKREQQRKPRARAVATDGEDD